MFIPATFTSVFLLTLLSMACWGTWSNTAKAAKDMQFGHFYWDYSVGMVVMGLIMFTSLGSMQFWNDDNHQNMYRVWAAVGAGVVFNWSNLLLTACIQILGLAVAFPLGIGTALVSGTVLTDLVSPGANRALLYPGVVLALLAVCSISLSAIALEKSLKKNGLLDSDMSSSFLAPEPQISVDDLAGSSVDFNTHNNNYNTHNNPDDRSILSLSDCEEDQQQTNISARNMALCLLSGLGISCWSPLIAYSYNAEKIDNGGITVYASFMVFTTTCLITSMLYCPIIIYRPLVGARSTICSYSNYPKCLHVYPLIGGALWSIGTQSNFIAGGSPLLGPAISYAIGQAAPMVAVGWGDRKSVV